jgi:hypothetical protein
MGSRSEARRPGAFLDETGTKPKLSTNFDVDGGAFKTRHGLRFYTKPVQTGGTCDAASRAGDATQRDAPAKKGGVTKIDIKLTNRIPKEKSGRT